MNDSILENRTQQIEVKANAAGVIAGGCSNDAAVEACEMGQVSPVVCEGDMGCIMGIVFSNQSIAREQSECVQGVVATQGACVEVVAVEAGNVAIEVPKMIGTGIGEGLGAFCGPNGCLREGSWLGNVLFGKFAFDMAENATNAAAGALIAMGRPNVDNSTNGSYNQSRTSADGNTEIVVGDGSLVAGGDGFLLGPDSQYGDRGDLNSGDGRFNSPGDNCDGDGNQCNPSNLYNPIEQGQPPPPNGIAAPSPIRDGFCFAFWNDEAQSIDPDCG